MISFSTKGNVVTFEINYDGSCNTVPDKTDEANVFNLYILLCQRFILPQCTCL